MEFTGLSLTELSAFLAIEIQASIPGRSARKRFARTIQIAGLPEDRLQRLLAGMLRDRTRLMQLLWLLLCAGRGPVFRRIQRAVGKRGRQLRMGCCASRPAGADARDTGK